MLFMNSRSQKAFRMNQIAFSRCLMSRGKSHIRISRFGTKNCESTGQRFPVWWSLTRSMVNLACEMPDKSIISQCYALHVSYLLFFHVFCSL